MIEKLFEILNPKNINNELDNLTTYGVFDGVKYPMSWSNLEDGVLNYDMLFREENLRKEMEKVAPYFVELDFSTETGIEQSKDLMACYGKNGCIFMTSDQNFEKVMEAMRELFYVYTHEGIKGYLRFYDPSVFRMYSVQEDSNIRYALFNGIQRYWCECEHQPGTVIEYLEQDKKLIQKEITIKKELI